MKINYPKAQIATDEDIIKLKEEQLASPDLIMTIAKRIDGFLADKAFVLDPNFDWIIVKDNQGFLCLVPLKKE